MKRSHLVYASVNIVQFAAVVASWGLHTTKEMSLDQPAWVWPLTGTAVVDRPFSPPATQWGAGHRGVDLRGETGAPVRAAGAGTVTYSGLLAGRGVVVVSHDDGLRTTYEPLVTDGPRVGAQVRPGDTIGHLGTGHASCRAGTTCLHWGLRRGGEYLDPLGLVLRGRIRLLPVPAHQGLVATERRSSAARDGVGTAALGGDDPAYRDIPTAAPPEVGVQDAFLNTALNVAAIGVTGYGGFAAVRRTRRFLAARRARRA